MIKVTWTAFTEHQLELDHRRLVELFPDVVTYLPEDFGYETTPEDVFLDALHAALEERPSAYRIAGTLEKQTSETTYVPLPPHVAVERDRIEAELAP